MTESVSSQGDLHRPTFAQVDTSRIRANFETFRRLLPEGAFLCPMVKANAYGHGDVEVARALRAAGARHLGVALIEEGIKLRRAGDQGGLLFFGLFEEQSASAVLEHDLTPVLSNWEQLESLKGAAKRFNRSAGTRIKIHLKFNTGMNRMGFAVEQASKLREWIDAHQAFELEGVCTHLLRGDDAGRPGGESESQFEAFVRALLPFQGLDFHPHALNSSGLANLWKRALDKAHLGRGAFWPLGARPGIGIYGVQPSNDESVRLPLVPALSLKSRIVMLHRLKAGERVSYNATWRAQRDSLIGVLPIGYGDGYFRLLSNRASVLCRGHRAPVAGTVCMDSFMIDLTDVEAKGPTHLGAIKPGEEVVLIGRQGGEEVTASELASLIGTIPYEILTHISERVPRLYVSESESK